MTAMSEPAYRGISPYLNFATVKAIIRKDIRTLWPLAAAVAAMTLLASAFFHETNDFPDLTIRYGRNVSIELGPVLFFLFVAITLIGGGLFVVMLAQQDRATDARNDWMARPIKAGELVLAKALILAAVVLAPMALGSLIAVLTGILEADVAIFSWFFTMIACALFITLGWLCSGMTQAILATIGVIILTLLMTTVSIGMSEVRQAMTAERAVAVPVEEPPPAPPTIVPAPPEFVSVRPMERPAAVRSSNEGWMEGLPILAGLFVAAIGGVGVTLWLLLGRRQVLPARLTFVSLYALGVLGLTQSIDVVDRSAAITMPAPSTLEQRIASFAKNDANDDNKLDKAEYQNVLNDLGYPNELDNFWVQRDRDGDGFISLEEIRPEVGLTGPPAPSLEQRMTAFTQYDADHDNKLTKEEYAVVLRSLGFGGQVETYWPQRDVDKDGFVTMDEYRNPIPQ